MSLFAPTTAESRRKFIYGVSACAMVVFIGFGVFAENGWLPHTDALTGKKSGWFGKELPKNARSTWNPLAAPSPTPTPQLSKEYIYAGQRLLAVEDANANPAPPADLAVWRPSDGNWYVLGGPGSQQTTYHWGQPNSSDKPIPGDYDGDGKTDFAIFRPPSSTDYPYVDWAIVYSGGGGDGGQWGTFGDVPARADFDGDGRTDIAVYRPSEGNWYILSSSAPGTVIGYHLGSTGDVPAPADYDGDGKADAAVWRSSDHSLYIQRSSDAQIVWVTISSASSSVVPVPADYDGDGKADCALYDPSIDHTINPVDNWTIFQSSNNATVTHWWGNPGDIPVPNDYDGDGKCDIAVWRPQESSSHGIWFIINSSDGSVRSESWGNPGDIPVPAYFRR